MGILLVFIGELLFLGEGMLTRDYARRHGDGGFVFNALVSLFSLIFCVVSDKNGFYFPREIWIYGIVSGFLYAGGFYFAYLAFQKGPYALTKLLSSFGLIFPISFGILFLNEKAGIFTYIGIVLIFLSLFLINCNKIEVHEKKKASFLWLVSTFIMILCNGFIGICSRLQQIRFDNKCTNEYLIIALSISFVFLAILGVVSDKSGVVETVKRGLLHSGGIGILSAMKNLITMAIYLYIPISIACLLKTGLGMVLTFMVSLLLYKERFTKIQYVGVVFGIIALLLMNI